MQTLRTTILFLLFGLLSTASAAPSFKVSLDPALGSDPVDGRLIIAVSVREEGEPRFHVGWRLTTAQSFGVTVDGWTPGESAMVDQTAIGHPLHDLSQLPPGLYNVQAILNVYETFQRGDGKTLKLPADNGEGQQWSRSPGNLYSEPMQVTIDGDSVVELQLTKRIPEIDPPQDTPFVRHFSMKSELLSTFWGRDIVLKAIVVVPHGFDEESDQHYPVLYNQGHFPSRQRALIEQIPDLESMSPRRRRFMEPRIEFSKQWMAGELPKALIVYTQHPTPYYDDSYGLNSANMGPYGDALTQEFYPALEKAFRGHGEAWGRILFGGSTGGWMSIAQQIFYPDFFGGAWGFCPDPLDFHAFQLINVYEDNQAFYDVGPFKKMPRGIGRSGSGHIFTTVEDFTRQEQVIGTHGRSGGQMDAFHATFGPTTEEGYPRPLWDPLTGVIDREVADYWVENYDLTAKLAREWETIGPKLVGKLHITMGTKDTFYLETATEMMEAFLVTTEEEGNGPAWDGSVVYGDNAPHCYTATPSGEAMEAYYLPIWIKHVEAMRSR